MTPRWPRALFACTLAALLAACGGESKPNVLLVIGDTLRADKLGVYGNTTGLTPYLDRLGESGVVYENAYGHAPWTLPSTASLLTSLHPRQHGAGGNMPNITGVDDAVTTLAEHLRSKGYKTHSIVNVLFLGESFGLGQGFDSVDAVHYKSNIDMRPAEATTSAAVSWLDENADDGPFFLLVHYFDPHAVYAPPQPFRRRFAGDRDKEDESFVFGTREQMMALRYQGTQFPPRVLKRAEKLYDGEIAYMDAEMGRLIDTFDARTSGEDIIVFTTDHGEEWLDHGGFEHGHTLYPELTHVPLILRAPELAPGREARTVRHIDVFPTLCNLLDFAAPAQCIGRSLVPLASDAQLPGRPVLAHGNMWGPPLTSWRNGDHVLILGPPEPNRHTELYRWTDDPMLKRNILAENSDLALQMAAEVEVHEKSLRAYGTGLNVELSPEEARALEGLGYGGEAPPPDDEQE